MSDLPLFPVFRVIGAEKPLLQKTDAFLFESENNEVTAWAKHWDLLRSPA